MISYSCRSAIYLLFIDDSIIAQSAKLHTLSFCANVWSTDYILKAFSQPQGKHWTACSFIAVDVGTDCALKWNKSFTWCVRLLPSMLLIHICNFHFISPSCYPPRGDNCIRYWGESLTPTNRDLRTLSEKVSRLYGRINQAIWAKSNSQ